MRLVLTCVALVIAAGCGPAQAVAGDSQNPPVVGAEELEDWLAAGFYLHWHCESSRHRARPPSPHERNRTCKNDLAAEPTPGEFRVDSAFVKESYDDKGAITGYAVQRHTHAGTDGASWFWYRRVPLSDTAFPHDQNGVVAIGWPATGTAADTICVGCHMEAGLAGFSGHDFVFNDD